MPLPVIISIVGTVIGVLAFFVSAYTLWSSRIRGADLKVRSTGRISISKNPNVPEAVQGAVTLPILVTNEGAQTGYILDVAVKVKRIGATTAPVTLRSYYDSLDEEIHMSGPVPASRSLPFAAFAVKPGESVVKRVFLVPHEKQIQFAWAKGEYEITPYTREHAHEGWRKWPALEIAVGADILAELDKTIIQPSPSGGNYVTLNVQIMTTMQAEDAVKKLAREQDAAAVGKITDKS